jgi:hypothetical protein
MYGNGKTIMIYWEQKEFATKALRALRFAIAWHRLICRKVKKAEKDAYRLLFSHPRFIEKEYKHLIHSGPDMGGIQKIHRIFFGRCGCSAA